MDPYAPRTEPQSCEPIYSASELERRRPGVWAFIEAWTARWSGRSLGVARDCDLGSTSAHHESRAWDWGPSAGEGLEGWQVRARRAVRELTETDEQGNPDALARKLGLRNIIFDGQIWTADPLLRWRPYDGADPHTSHVHFDWGWDGALAKTSGYEGGPANVPLRWALAGALAATVAILANKTASASRDRRMYA